MRLGRSSGTLVVPIADCGALTQLGGYDWRGLPAERSIGILPPSTPTCRGVAVGSAPDADSLDFLGVARLLLAPAVRYLKYDGKGTSAQQGCSTRLSSLAGSGSGGRLLPLSERRRVGLLN